MPYNYSDPFNLKLNDIDGTNVGSKNRISKFNSNNYNLLLNDIKGAKSGSLSKGIVSTRHLNPLTPDYKYLGQTEIANSVNNPYGKSEKKDINKTELANSNNNLNSNKEK